MPCTWYVRSRSSVSGGWRGVCRGEAFVGKGKDDGDRPRQDQLLGSQRRQEPGGAVPPRL